MKELNKAELEMVNGAGAFADSLAKFGETIGKLIPVPFGSKIGGFIGKTVGNVAESAFDFFKNLFNDNKDKDTESKA